MRRCANPGCEAPALIVGAKFCGPECRQLAREQRDQERHIRKIFEQAELAPRPETCRGCPGGYCYQDERGDAWCMCGRNATEISGLLKDAA